MYLLIWHILWVIQTPPWLVVSIKRYKQKKLIVWWFWVAIAFKIYCIALTQCSSSHKFTHYDMKINLFITCIILRGATDELGKISQEWLLLCRLTTLNSTWIDSHIRMHPICTLNFIIRQLATWKLLASHVKIKNYFRNTQSDNKPIFFF